MFVCSGDAVVPLDREIKEEWFPLSSCGKYEGEKISGDIQISLKFSAPPSSEVGMRC